jgi:hypothetical protein
MRPGDEVKIVDMGYDKLYVMCGETTMVFNRKRGAIEVYTKRSRATMSREEFYRQ